MVIVLFCRGKERYYGRGFILISVQLIICDFMAFLPQIFLVLPEILQTESNSYAYTATWIGIAFASCKSFSSFAILNFSLLLAASRFVSVALPKYNAIFESRRLYFSIAFVWLMLLGVEAADLYHSTRIFNASNLSWEKYHAGSGKQLWLRMRGVWKLAVPIVMFVLYFAIFCIIRRKRQRVANVGNQTSDVYINHYERSMLSQAAWYCGTMEFGILISKYLPIIWNKYIDKSDNIPLKVVLNCYIIFICALLPTIHFIYSEDSRNVIKHRLYHFLKLKIERIKNKATTESVRI